MALDSGEDPDDADGDNAKLPGLNVKDRPVFDAPWQARAFAVAVALSGDDTYEWSTFQERLVAEIDRRAGPEVPADATASEEIYYRQWLAALERLLVADGVIDPGELDERATDFADGERDASEWVDGDRDHEHAHGLGHSHTHGSGDSHTHGSGDSHTHEHHPG